MLSLLLWVNMRRSCLTQSEKGSNISLEVRANFNRGLVAPVHLQVEVSFLVLEFVQLVNLGDQTGFEIVDVHVHVSELQNYTGQMCDFYVNNWTKWPFKMASTRVRKWDQQNQYKTTFKCIHQ